MSGSAAGEPSRKRRQQTERKREQFSGKPPQKRLTSDTSILYFIRWNCMEVFFMKTSCPHCGQHFEVEAEFAGRNVVPGGTSNAPPAANRSHSPRRNRPSAARCAGKRSSPSRKNASIAASISTNSIARRRRGTGPYRSCPASFRGGDSAPITSISDQWGAVL